MWRYKVTVPNWYSGVLTTETVDGKEVVIATSLPSKWAVGKTIFEASSFYNARTGGTVEPISSKKKIVRRTKRRVVRIRRNK